MRRTQFQIGLALLALQFSVALRADEHAPTYHQLRQAFTTPDHARWGEVPLWWWEGDRMANDRMIWQLETLADKGVKAVCPIQRSPARCDPPSFTPEWWRTLQLVHEQCRHLGMRLWTYDQIGYGHYGWLEKAAAKTPDRATAKIVFLTADASPDHPTDLQLPIGKLLGARAYPMTDGVKDGVKNGVKDETESIDLSPAIVENVLRWQPKHGKWRVAVSVAVPEPLFRLSTKTTDTFLDMLYGEIERRLGREAMGSSFAGVFQDEHPPTPRDVYTDHLADTFRRRFGYDLGRAIPALHFDVGAQTPKYRTDFFDAYLAEDERCYWKRVYDWTHDRGLLTSHDNWGRNSLPSQSQGYIDYFRTQRWFSAPGYDDAGQHPVDQRNYYDTKIASSIARLYHRPRVWSEAFHSSGWGRTTDQTLSWLTANFAFGANLYDEHGLYYSTRASTWEHAAPDPHWRQPYWCYYNVLSDWVARTSYLMSQGTHVVDAAVHYPVVSFLAGHPPQRKGPDYNQYMGLSRALYDAAIDNDIIDDDSIVKAQVNDGELIVSGNSYQAIVFGPELTVRLSVLRQALRLAENGGCVVFYGQLPSGSTDAGRNDMQVKKLLTQMFGTSPEDTKSRALVSHVFPTGGCAAFVRDKTSLLAPLVSRHIKRDFFTEKPGRVFVTHRRIGAVDVYLLQNPSNKPLGLAACCRIDAVPELWDPFTGKITPVDAFERAGGVTHIHHQLEGNTAYLLAFHPGDRKRGNGPEHLLQPDNLHVRLSENWEFSTIPTRDNRWGEFRWPPTNAKIGPERRSFRYCLQTEQTEHVAEWHKPDFDDSQWATVRYSIGPYWLYINDVPKSGSIDPLLEQDTDQFGPGSECMLVGKPYRWQTIEFSKTIGLARPAPWGGHSGYPDGAIDQNFIDLPPGRKLLFTRICSPKVQRLGLRIALGNTKSSLWVNGVQQPVEGAVGSLPLRQGPNDVLIELPDGGRGMLYVQSHPPSATTLADVATDATRPPLANAAWIHASDSGSGYVRRAFTLKATPVEAKLAVTAYTGYRLFVNGHQVEEDIGPWAKWTHPETVDVARYLRPGKNVLAAWGQVHEGQNVHGDPANQAIVLALKAKLPDGSTFVLVTDGSWKGSVRELTGWETPQFDDSGWLPVRVLGRMGIKPWGNQPVENLGAVTQPRRKLAIDLPSPLLTCFDDVPDVQYDIKPLEQRWYGWYRFQAPPGLRRLRLPTITTTQVWVNGHPVPVHNGNAEVREPPIGVSQVVIRLALQPGAYGGAALPQPIGLDLDGGQMQVGRWADFALPTYSGIGVYRQTVMLSQKQVDRPTSLDLGNVLVAAEVLINGRSAGVRLARPFRFDLTGLLRTGRNRLEIRVANTIAPHYTVTNQSHNLGPTDSGLLGPVVLSQQLPLHDWTVWAQAEMTRLRQTLNTSTQPLEAAQHAWEAGGYWSSLAPANVRSAAGSKFRQLPDGSILVSGKRAATDTYQIDLDTKVTGIRGMRLEALPHSSLPDGGPGRGMAGDFLPSDLQLTVSLPNNRRFLGRKVRIQIVNREEYLHMAEVQVFSHGKNVALQGSARQSTTSNNALANRAIDDDTNGSWSGNSVCHTNRQRDPWWEVDLGTDLPIDRIVIWNRTDGVLETRLTGFRVSLIDSSGKTVWQQLVTNPPDPKATFSLSRQTVTLHHARAGVDQPQCRVTRTMDVSANDTAWQVDPGRSHRQVVIYEADTPFGFPDGSRLSLKLRQAGGNGDSLGCFRVSITSRAPPLYDVPPSIRRILDVAPSARTSEDATRLAAFYRTIAPELSAARTRLARLQRDLRRVQRN